MDLILVVLKLKVLLSESRLLIHASYVTLVELMYNIFMYEKIFSSYIGHINIM
jgi:hypothetical protein